LQSLVGKGIEPSIYERVKTLFLQFPRKKIYLHFFPGKQEEIQVNFVLIKLYDSNTQAGYYNASAALF
jgi:hypothetical protein